MRNRTPYWKQMYVSERNHIFYDFWNVILLSWTERVICKLLKPKWVDIWAILISNRWPFSLLKTGLNTLYKLLDPNIHPLNVVQIFQEAQPKFYSNSISDILIILGLFWHLYSSSLNIRIPPILTQNIIL